MGTGIYVRVSTEEQVKEGYSIRGQEQKLKDYARIKDWHVYDVYIDEGISGKNITARPEINRLIEDVKDGHVKNVLVFKIDRLTRSTSDLIFLVDLFNEYDCSFNSLMESIDTQTASGRMFLKIIGIFAEFERENIAERIILGRERKVSEGYTLCSHTASYGYDRPSGQKIQTIIEDEAKIVREIFELYANQGLGMTEIGRRLKMRGVPTKHGGKWTTGGVKNILKNNNYMGDVRHRFEDEERAYTVKGKHEPIISEELFNKTQHRMTKTKRISPTKQPREENYFAGFLVCASCGYKLYPHNIYKTLSDGTPKLYGNYECGNIEIDACNASSMSAIRFEDAFRIYIDKITDFEGNNSIHIQEEAQKKQANQQLIAEHKGKLQQLEAKLREALDCYVNNIFTIEEYRKVKKRIENDKYALSSDLDRLNIEAESIVDNKLEIAKSFRDNWDIFTNSEKRVFLMQFVEKIIVVSERTGKNQYHNTIIIHDIVFKGMDTVS